ncbi:MAG: hypothetical protein AAB668_02320 [Patescibacteria group bacterium]
MNILKAVGRRVDALVKGTYKLIAARTECESAEGRDRVHAFGYERVYHDAMHALKELGDERVTLTAQNVDKRIRREASRYDLADGLTTIMERVSSDARVPVAAKDAVKAITYRARDTLRAGTPAAN